MPPTTLGAIADGLIAALESPAAQAAIQTTVAAGEVNIKAFGDALIADAKGTGFLGVAIAAGKGSVEAEFDAELAKFTPADITAFITKMAADEAKKLGG